METLELKARILDVLGGSETREEFAAALVERGVQVEWTENLSGVKFRPAGSSTWLKGSSLDRRELAASKIVATLQRNQQLRLEARQSAASLISTIDAQAADHVLERLIRQENINAAASLPPPVSRAVPLSARGKEVEQMHAATDELDFLSEDSPPQATDDVALGAPSQAQVSEKEQAEAELASELQRMTIAQLYDLRKLGKIPPVVLTAAQIEVLINLVLKILTLGLVRRANLLADRIASSDTLAQRASDELQRRERTPGTAAERRRRLDEEIAALRHRQDELLRRAAGHTLAPPASRAIERWVREADALAAARGRTTVSRLRADLQSAASAAEELEGELYGLRRAEVGFFGKLGRKAAAARAHLRELERKLAATRARHEEFRVALVALLDNIQKKHELKIQAETQRLEAERREESKECHQMGLLLDERRPLGALDIQIRRDLETERLRRRPVQPPGGSKVDGKDGKDDDVPTFERDRG